MSVSLYGSGQTVIQVVQGTLSTDFSTGSTTPVATGLTASITPQSTTSKILVIINTVVSANGSTYGGGAFAVYRNGSSVYTDPSANNALYGAANTAAPQARITLFYLDSPSTTSSTTYALYGFSRSGGTMDVSYSNSLSTITLMEISQS
jgi:hypothetical protein